MANRIRDRVRVYIFLKTKEVQCSGQYLNSWWYYFTSEGIIHHLFRRRMGWPCYATRL